MRNKGRGAMWLGGVLVLLVLLASLRRIVAGPPGTVTVVRGDSLWAIAHRHLGAQANAQQIAREWPRWYAANRTVIGPNPNLIRAGQVLTVPTSGPS